MHLGFSFLSFITIIGTMRAHYFIWKKEANQQKRKQVTENNTYLTHSLWYWVAMLPFSVSDMERRNKSCHWCSVHLQVQSQLPVHTFCAGGTCWLIVTLFLPVTWVWGIIQVTTELFRDPTLELLPPSFPRVAASYFCRNYMHFIWRYKGEINGKSIIVDSGKYN